MLIPVAIELETTDAPMRVFTPKDSAEVRESNSYPRVQFKHFIFSFYLRASKQGAHTEVLIMMDGPNMYRRMLCIRL